MKGLAGKNVIITGGANGIGRATCLRFAEEGASIAIFDMDIEGAEETVRLIQEQQQQSTSAHSSPKQCIKAYKVDITDYAAIEHAVTAFIEECGPVNILVNNAGWDVAKPFLQTDPDLWKKIIDINLYGPLHMHHIVAAHMAQQGAGKIINISSDAGRVGSSGEAVYAACKGGVIAFTKTLARELARSNIQLNAICPGPTDTALFADFAGDGEAGEKLRAGLARAIPMRRLGQVDDYPGLICFLASEDADFITGQTISISGGLTMHG